MKQNNPTSIGALRLEPQYHSRVWGGHRLKPDTDELIGEAWVVHERNVVADGPHAGRTLGELAEQFGEALLGTRASAETGTRFPLLIKLLDCAAWLSVQVHPDDRQAVELEGPGQVGKTEAWHVVKAEAGAQLISGLKPGTLPVSLERAIREGTVVELAQYHDVQGGDTLLTHAGTIHALGPGLLIYEVQQTSDITYRIYDWDRPQDAGRKLHIEQAVAVSNPHATGQVSHLSPLEDGDRRILTCCRYFSLELLGAQTKPVQLDTAGASFHALTVIEGEMQVEAGGWSETLGLHRTLLVPANCGPYSIAPRGKYRALKAAVA